jgi:hypothetical protein
VNEVEVRWPDGSVETLGPLEGSLEPANRTVTIRQRAPGAETRR